MSPFCQRFEFLIPVGWISFPTSHSVREVGLEDGRQLRRKEGN
jgi:hypothetical protein